MTAGRFTRGPGLAIALGVGAWLGVGLHAGTASACGGFFCSSVPVDQTAERILFEVGEDSVTMTTQISFNGAPEDFAWVLPLSEVPLAESLAVFHQQALNALDLSSGPVFNLPQECSGLFSCPNCAGPADDDSVPGVNVYIRQEVGEYDVAVVGSDDPTALVAWLRQEGYRVTSGMEPYIDQYLAEGLDFLALKLLPGADVSDLRPFRFTVPGTAPTIPLRMTAVAAEPEMSIVAFVLADARFEGKNWPNLEIDDARIRFNRAGTNWPRLVADAVDEAEGQGWVTEFAGPSAALAQQVRQQVEAGAFPSDDARLAATELLDALEGHAYLTRLYTRLSAEEMISDPVFGRSDLGDVDRVHQLERFVDNVDQCNAERAQSSNDPCDFATCGAAGVCRTASVLSAGSSVRAAVAGCACAPGATARATLAPDGSPTVICQDGRMSFLEAGDRDDDTGEVLPDVCAGFDCGEHGQCVGMSLTPTCVCDIGFVAIGGAAGNRAITCVAPDAPVPADIYDKRLPALPDGLPGGREVELPTSPQLAGSAVAAGKFPVPRETPDLATHAGGGSCSLQHERHAAPWWLALALGLSHVRRRLRVRGQPASTTPAPRTRA